MAPAPRCAAVEPADDRRRHGSPDGVRDRLRRLRRGRADDRAAAVDADRPFAPVEGPGPLPEPVATGSSRTTGAATAARTARRTPTPTAMRDGSATSSAVMDATDTAAAILVGLCGDGVWRAIELAAAEPGARPRDRRLRGRRPAPRRRRTRGRSQWSFDDELPTDEGWAKLNRHYLAGATTRASRGSSSRRSRPSRIRPSRSRTPSSGRSTARSTR